MLGLIDKHFAPYELKEEEIVMNPEMIMMIIQLTLKLIDLIDDIHDGGDANDAGAGLASVIKGALAVGKVKEVNDPAFANFDGVLGDAFARRIAKARARHAAPAEPAAPVDLPQ